MDIAHCINVLANVNVDICTHLHESQSSAGIPRDATGHHWYQGASTG